MTEGSRPVATAEGTLANTPFAHVLLYAAQQSLSGTLAVWPEGSTSGEPSGPPDRILMSAGIIVGARFAALASSLEMGMLSLFTRVEASYAFYGDQDLVGSGDETRTGKVDPFAIIAASLRGAARDDVVQEILARVEGRPLRVRANADVTRFALNPKEQIVVELLRAEPATADQIIASSGLPTKTAIRTLYLLVVTKTAEPFDQTRATGSHMVGSPVVSRLTPAHGAPLPARSSDAGAAVKVSTSTAERHAPAAASAASPASEHGKAAPPKSSVAATPASSAAPAPVAGRASASPGRRSVPPHGGTAGVDLPEPPPGLAPELVTMWHEVAQRAHAIEDQNFFEMLGVPRDCGSQRARDSYFELVKRFHPDRLPPELAPLLPFAQTIFRYLTEAHDVVSDEAKRMKYIGLVKDGGGTPAEQKKMNSILDAAMEFQKAEVLAKRRDFDGALKFLRSAISMNPEEADFHTLLALTLFQKHTGADAPIVEMLTEVDLAIKLNERSDRAHYCKAVILKRVGQQAEALKHFRRAAELNPEHVEAVREVRLATMRGTIPKSPVPEGSSAASGGGPGGLLSKLFGGQQKKK